MFEFISSLFLPVPPTKAQLAQRQKANTKKIVALHSRGNINLQKGSFLTKFDVQARRQETANLNLK